MLGYRLYLLGTIVGVVVVVFVFRDAALIAFSEAGALMAVQFLLAIGANVNATDSEGNTPLIKACIMERMSVAKLLVEHGAEVNAANGNGWTPLVWAALGRPEMLRFLLDNQADPNATTAKGRTALMKAVEGGRVENARLLLENGADVGARDRDGHTALSKASCRCAERAIETLLRDFGAPEISKSEDQRNWSFVLACELGSVKDVERFLWEGIDVNARHRYGSWAPALVIAANAGRYEIVKILLDHGADVNATAWQGQTALMRAAKAGEFRVVYLLLDMGADVNAREDVRGRTALMMASKSGYAGIIRLLLANGARVNAMDKSGASAVDLTSDEAIRKLLVQRGAKESLSARIVGLLRN